jgi:CheY-like chemotaxis protein
VRHRLRALVVADHDRMRSIFSAMLAARGVEVSMVEGAAAAEDSVARAPYDVAFLEAASAGTDGYALAAALHARAPEVAICMLVDAGVGVGEAVRRGRDGIFAYLRKPVLEGDLDRELALLASDERPTASREPVARAGSPTPTDVRRRGATILVAEDHPVNQALVRRRLQNLGHEVTVVADGAAAVEACASTVFDLVLMDVEMPGMDGLEATRRIRGAEATSGRRTPIIALTALAFEHDRELALSAGMDGYLTKPVSPDALAQVLQEHCGAPA